MQNIKLFIMCAIASFIPWGMLFIPLGIEVQIIGFAIQIIGTGVLIFRRKDIF